MSRYFMIQSWVGSHENEPDYNGQQAGERNVRSIEVVPLYDQFGNANTKAFSDEAIKARPSIKKKSVVDSIDLAQRYFDRLERMSIQLDDEYSSGSIDAERYELLRYKMDERLIKAWQRLEKENAPIWEKEDRRYEQEKGLVFNIDDVVLDKRSNVDYSLIPEDSLFSKLSNGNLFKDFYCRCLTTYKTMLRIYNTLKQVVQEGIL